MLPNTSAKRYTCSELEVKIETIFCALRYARNANW